MRVNMVPKDGGNAFHGVVFGNYAPSRGRRTTADRPARRRSPARARTSPATRRSTRRTTSSPTSASSPRTTTSTPASADRSRKDKAWFYATFRYLGVNKTVADSFFDRRSRRRSAYTPDTSRPGIDDGHIRSIAGRVSAQLSSKDKVSYYHDEQDKVRGHWGIASTVPPEASAIQATPTSFVSVSKWTRTHTQPAAVRRRLGGLRPGVPGELSAGRVRGHARTLRHAASISATGKIANAWNNPADHFSKLFTEQFAAIVRHRLAFVPLRRDTSARRKWRLAQQYTGDVAADHLQRRPRTDSTRCRHAAHSDRSPQLDQERQRRLRAGQVDDQARDDQRRRPLGLVHQRDADPETLPASTLEPGGHLQQLLGRQEQPERRAASAA